MRTEAFRAFLTSSLTPGAVGSYLSNLRRVERVLQADLDQLELSPAGIGVLRTKLAAHGITMAKQNDCASAMRKYAAFRSGDLSSFAAPPSAPTPPVRSRTSALTLKSVPELMRLYADVLSELRERGVLRTGNGPVGDYAEMLFANAFGWRLAGNSTSGHDAIDEAGVRYQIKARRVGSRNPSRQLGALRRLPERGFDVLAAVLFDEDVNVLRAALIPFATVETIARRVEHTNSWRVVLSDNVWALPGVRDVTVEVGEMPA